MSYKILASREFEKDFMRLDDNFQRRIKKKIREVAEMPSRYKHLRPPLNNYCRIRVGKLRVLFSYSLDDEILYVEKIVFGHRY